MQVYAFPSQDLPEFFEDNMETWMTNFHTLLTLDNKLLQTDVSTAYTSWFACVVERVD